MVAVSNLIDGEFSVRGSINAFLDPSKLSPSERSTFESRLKATAGNNPISNALIGLATNPFVWLGLAFMPGTKGALHYGVDGKTPGRILTGHVRGRQGAFLNQYLSHATEELQGTPAALAAIHQLSQAQDLRTEWENGIGKPLQKLVKALGMKEGTNLLDLWHSKDPNHRLIADSIQASLQGDDIDQRWVSELLSPKFYLKKSATEKIELKGSIIRDLEMDRRRRASSNLPMDGLKIREMSDGSYRIVSSNLPPFPPKDPGMGPHPDWKVFDVEMSETLHWTPFEEFRPAKLKVPIPGGLEGYLKSVGGGAAWEVRNAIRDQMKIRFLRQVAKDDSIEALMKGRAITADDIDPRKVKALYRMRFGGNASGHMDPEELDFASSLFSSDMREALQMRKEWAWNRRKNKEGDWELTEDPTGNAIFSYEEWERHLQKSVVARLQGFDSYMPRNVVGHYTLKGKPGDPNYHLTKLTAEELGHIPTKEGPSITGRTHERVDPDPAWGLDSINRFEDTFGRVGWLSPGNSKGDYGWEAFKKKSIDPTVAYLAGGRTDELTGERIKQRGATEPVRLVENDLPAQLTRYQRQTAEDLIRTAPIPPEIVREQIRLFKMREDRGYPLRADQRFETPLPFPKAESTRSIMRPFDDRWGPAPDGGWVIGDLEDQTLAMMAAVPEGQQSLTKHRQETYRDVVLPHIYGTYDPGRNTRRMVARTTQHWAKSLADGPIGQMFSKMSGVTKSMMDKLRDYGEMDIDTATAMMSRVNSRAAGTLYGNTLGWNPASIILQFFQPYVGVAGYAGFANTMKAHAKAIQEVSSYIKAYHAKKMELGGPWAKVPADVIRKLKEEHFEFPEEAGIFGHAFEDLDTYVSSPYSHESSLSKKILEEWPLEGFSKAEWVNKMTTFHAIKNQYLQAQTRKGTSLLGVKADGRLDKSSPGFAAFLADAHEIMVNTQFPGGVMNTPAMLRNVPVLARQFMTFGVRSLISPFRMGPRINEGIRYFNFGDGIQVPGGHRGWMIADPLRLMGVSAAIWEVGSAFGVDPSYGLVGSTTTSLFNPGEDVLTKGVRNLPIQLPPAATATINNALGLVQALGGDTSLLRENISRLIPGGIALQRALGAAPDMPALLGGFMQKTYADYANPNEAGMVPVYKFDGSLLRFEKPTNLVLGGLGVDLNAHKQGQEIDAYLVKNREEIIQYQQRAMMALMANDIPKMQSVAREFEARFQIPLTLTKQQVSAFTKQRQVGRTERILDTLPTAIRTQYQDIIRGRHDNYGITEEALMGAATASSRTAAFGRMPGPELNPETTAQIQQLIEEQKRIKALNEATFQGLQSPTQ